MASYPRLAVLCLCGCAVPGSTTPGGGAPLLAVEWPDASPQQVLAELPRIYRELGLPVAAVQEARFEIRSGNFAAPTLANHQFESENYRCGTPMRVVRGTSMREHATISTSLQLDADGKPAGVRSRLSAERTATYPDGSTERRTCLSTGELENRIAELLNRHFGRI